MAGRGNYKAVDFYQERTHNIVDGFEAFSDKGLYYFTCNKNSEVFIISEGYTSSSARNRGIQSAAKNLLLATQYHFESLSANQFYFTLKAGNNQEIAKSKIFETEEAMHALIGWIIGKRFSANLIYEEDINENLSITNNGTDQLLSGMYSNQVDYFIFKGTNGKQYFSFKNKAGKTLLLNTNVRGYDNMETVNKILSEVLEFAANLNNYDFKLTKNGKYYFYLKNLDAANIAKSTFFATEEEMMEVIQVLTLEKMEVSKNNDVQKNIAIRSDLFSEIDNNGKVDLNANQVEQNLLVNQPQKSKETIFEKPVETKQQNTEEEQVLEEDEFTALLKQQQQAELEVRLKREKEEKERKFEQNQFAKANAAVLRKHKEEQSIELDEKLKQEDLVKANKVEKTETKTKTVQEVLPLEKVELKSKVKLSPNKNKEKTKKAVTEKKPPIKETPKPVENVAKPKPVVEKKPIPKKETIEPKVKTNKTKVSTVKPPIKTETAVEKPKVKEPQKKSVEKEYDPEIEKAKIAAQARFDELKKAAEFRKRKEKEEQLATTVDKAPEKQSEKKSYDWWTKKEDITKEHPTEDIDLDEVAEPIDFIKMLKPALIGLLAIALLFVGFRSFKSSKENEAVVSHTNNNQLAGASSVSGTNSSIEEKYDNTTLPEKFANVTKGSVEWHIINCIVDVDCPQQQNFHWIETNFTLNGTYLSAEALQSLNQVAQIMTEYSNTRLDIFGHIATNEKDNFTAGKSLSEQRAKQVKDLLVEQGISADRLSFKGLANTQPIQAGNSLTAHHQNKRIELVLHKDHQNL